MSKTLLELIEESDAVFEAATTHIARLAIAQPKAMEVFREFSAYCVGVSIALHGVDREIAGNFSEKARRFLDVMTELAEVYDDTKNDSGKIVRHTIDLMEFCKEKAAGETGAR